MNLYEYISVFEQPLNERVRLFLRLEALFDQLKRFCQARDPYETQFFLDALLDVMDFLHRYEIRSDLLKELEHIRNRLEENCLPNVTAELLPQTLGMIEACHHFNYLPINQLRENELLISLRQRSTQRSGYSLFEIPAYQNWLLHHYQNSSQTFPELYGLFACIEEAINLCLDVFRQSGEPQEETTNDGLFIKNLRDRDATYHMLRLKITNAPNVFPRISSGKHRFSIRFMEQEDFFQRAQQVQRPIHFTLSICAFTH